MAEQRANKAPASSEPINWLAESFRATAFYVSAVKERSLDWKSFTESDPTQRSEDLSRGLYRESGPFRDALLTVTQQSHRIDFLWAADPSKPPKMEPWFDIGLYRDRADKFTQVARRWIGLIPAARRVGFGLIAISEAKDYRDAIRILMPLLPGIEFDPQNDSDIFWQINRPRPSSTIEGLVINRLSKWQIVQGRQLMVEEGNSPVPIGPTREIVRVELDISTNAEHEGSLARDSLPQLIDEMATAAHEFLEKGDIA